MPDIRNFGFIRHFRADAGSHVLRYRAGRLVAGGRGLTFWFQPLHTSIADVPTDDRELALVFHGRTADFQDVTLQGVLTFRVTDPAGLAGRVDFTVDLATGAWLRQPLEKLQLMLSQLAQQHAAAYIARTPIRTVLVEGQARVREEIGAALHGDAGVAELGLEVVSVRISSCKPTPELEKAMEAPMREHIQQEADEAAFSRRALAVEKERAIAENELQNRIELARREEQLIAQQGQNARRQATEQAEAARIGSEGEAERVRIEAGAEAERTRTSGEAQAVSIRSIEGARVEAEKLKMDTYRSMPPNVLLSLAAQQLAGKLQRIDHLNLGQDMFGPLLANLLEAGTRKLEGPHNGKAG